MQDPLQRPANQPFYLSSEALGQEQIHIYVPDYAITRSREQMQIYVPAHVITRSRMQAQEIAIYANRRQAIVRTIVVLIALLVLVLMIPFILIYGSTNGGPPPPDFLPVLVVCSMAMLLVITPFSWMTWRMASLIFSHEPLLIINSEGIKVGRIPTQSGFFIPWTEIEAISLYTRTYEYLCIHPGSRKEALRHFPWWERLIKRINMVLGIPPLIVPQFFLARPVEEILSTLYYRYANELTYYHVQLRP